MFSRFHVKGFRNLEALELNDLKRVNLIAGLNGVGKTTALEALFLHCGAPNPHLALRLRVFRGLGEKIAFSFARADEAPWQSLFGKYEGPGELRLESLGKDKLTRSDRFSVVTDLAELRRIPGLQQVLSGDFSDSSQPFPKVLRLEHEVSGHERETVDLIASSEGIRIEPVPPPVPFPAHFLHARRASGVREMAQRFGKMEKAGEQDKLVRMLKIIEPRLLRVATVVVGDDAVLHGDIGLGYLLPLFEMGDGIVRLAEVALAVREATRGVVLVDEVENGIHHSAMENVWRALRQAAREHDVQLFATTHSFECIAAAHRAFSEGDDYDLRLIRLERVKDKTRAVAYDRDVLEAAIEADLEVR